MSISAIELAATGIRLLAIYAALQGIVWLPASFRPVAWRLYAEIPAGYRLTFIGALVAPCLVALLLWVAAKPMARLIVGSPDQECTEAGASMNEFQVIAISTAGLIIIMLASPQLVQEMLYLYETSSLISEVGGERRLFKEDLVAGVIGSSLKLMIGLLLLTTSKFWVRLLNLIRNFEGKGV